MPIPEQKKPKTNKKNQKQTKPKPKDYYET